MLNTDMALEIDGIGFIMYSDFAVSQIENDEDYFTSHYSNPQQVVKHIEAGSIVGFCTGSPGVYIFKFRDGYPSEHDVERSEFRLRLGIEVRDQRICIRDVYDLIRWTNQCKPNQCIKMENGFYSITLLGNMPFSGILGDNQEIYIYLNKLEKMPVLKYQGVPTFCE